MKGFSREDLILLLVSFFIALALWFNVTIGKKDEGKQILPFNAKPNQSSPQGKLIPMSGPDFGQHAQRDDSTLLIIKI
jgi:hypothetical protein